MAVSPRSRLSVRAARIRGLAAFDGGLAAFNGGLAALGIRGVRACGRGLLLLALSLGALACTGPGLDPPGGSDPNTAFQSPRDGAPDVVPQQPLSPMGQAPAVGAPGNNPSPQPQQQPGPAQDPSTPDEGMMPSDSPQPTGAGGLDAGLAGDAGEEAPDATVDGAAADDTVDGDG